MTSVGSSVSLLAACIADSQMEVRAKMWVEAVKLHYCPAVDQLGLLSVNA